MLIDAGHAASFFALLSWLGAVSAALMRGMQTVAVFVSSAALFCTSEESQCITPTKIASIAVVLVGTLIYAIAPTVVIESAISTLPSLPSDDSSSDVEKLLPNCDLGYHCAVGIAGAREVSGNGSDVTIGLASPNRPP